MVEERVDVFAPRIGCGRQSDSCGQQVFRAQARLHAAKARETLDQETGADEEHEREGHFHDHEAVAQFRFPFPATSAARAGFQCRVQIELRRLPRREKPKDDAGAQRNQKCEPKHNPVELDGRGPGNVLRNRGDQRFGSPLRDQQTQQTAQAGEEKALGQKLSNDAATACTHGRTHRNLLSANRSAREEKVRDVGIRDQEHANDCAKQDVKPGPHIADQFLAQRPGGEARMCVLLRVLFFQRGGDGGEIGLRLLDRDTRLQTRHSLEHVIAALLGIGRILRDRDVEIGRVGSNRELKTRRQYTDHGVRLAIHRDRPPERAPVPAELPFATFRG